MKIIKKLRVCLGLFVLLIFLPAYASAEEILSFDSTIQINKTGTFEVKERISYDFGTEQKHGIFRNIPYKYYKDGKTIKTKISNISVTDAKKNLYNFEDNLVGNNVEIKIGDANKLVTGVHLYEINYTVDRALLFENDRTELYWNVTGNDWEVPIRSASASVLLPEDIAKEKVEYFCYSGNFGSNQKCSTSDLNSNKASFSEKSLLSFQGLTVAVSFPAGIVAEPKPDILTPILNSLVFVIPLVTLIVLILNWFKRGRDPEGRKTIVVQFDAPDNLRPEEVGTLVDNTADNKDITSGVVSLAIKGFLKINRLDTKILFVKSTDYELTKLKEADASLSKFEANLLSDLFGTGNSKKLSELKNTFYTNLPKLRTDIYEGLTEKGYFVKNPDKVRTKYLIIGIALFFLGVFSLFLLAFDIYGGLGLVPAGIITIIFSRYMPARTLNGAYAREHILGLKQYMQVAEKDRINFHNAPEKNTQLFEKFLPFAMVLGVEKEWAKQFEGIFTENPSWYGDTSGNAFSAMAFSNSMSTFANSASSTMASAPSSSGSGGGGFSGGGFGGGGGGSW